MTNSANIEGAGPRASSESSDRYRLLGRIASGGMGSVHLGIERGDVELSRLYAIKLIHEHLAEQLVFVEMLLAEADMTRHLSHANAVGICDTGQIDGRHFVVMPFIEGGTLTELTRRHSEPLSVGAAVRVMIDVLRGLHAAHSLKDEHGNPFGLVHQDVSPGNILVGIDGIARIIDFGVAKANARITQTEPGIIKGKFAYMAPEQALGDDIDCRADVFSAGVVLWTALTNRPLFTGENGAQTLKNLLSAKIVRPSEVRSEIAAGIDRVCMRALQRDPERRYQSAEEMAEALFSAADRAGMVATPEQVSDKGRAVFGQRVDRRREFVEKIRTRGFSTDRDGEPFGEDISDSATATAAEPSLITPLPNSLDLRLDLSPSLSGHVDLVTNPSISAVSLPQLAASTRTRRQNALVTYAIIALTALATVAALAFSL